MDLDFISHYRIVKMIGSGGMGEVYLAEDARLKRNVAIKLLRIESVLDEEKSSRFEKEARAASALNHPNILTVFDVGQTESFRYMVTEFVDGQTLRDYFRHGAIPIKKAAEIALSVARALEAAHNAGIVHRDIKPENLMVRRDGVLKVLDFGLAKLSIPQDGALSLVDTTPGLIMGTPRYMSPEQVRGLDVDNSTDVYSLGSVFYEMIAGTPPFDEATVGDTIAAVLTCQPVPLDRQNPNTPLAIQNIIERCLNKEREARYKTMTSLILELEKAIGELQSEKVTREIGHQFTEQPTIHAEAVDTGNNALVLSTADTANTKWASARGHLQKRPILSFGLAAVALVVLAFGSVWFASGGSETPDITLDKNAQIPVRVIDPLVGKGESNISDLHGSWEGAEEQLIASDISAVKATSPTAKDLKVSVSYFEDRQRKALEDRPGEKGVRPTGLQVPSELFDDRKVQQRRITAEMLSAGYRQPMDFADMAEKWQAGELTELPMATRSFYLDIGGSASVNSFTSFSIAAGSEQVDPEGPKFSALKVLADNFSGERYSLDDPLDRRQMRRRLLRMLHPRARSVLYHVAEAYHAKYDRPLRVTALTRPIDFQILLSSTSLYQYRAVGEQAIAPHSSGLAFDIARTHMPVDEQNFMMEQLAQMEQKGLLDAAIEYGAHASFHVFVYYVPFPTEYLN